MLSRSNELDLSAQEPGEWSRQMTTAGWLLVALGAAIRLRLYLQNRSLWIDEAMVSLNIIHRPIGQLWRPLDDHQAAPLGWLLMQKLSVTLFGSSEYALRLVPLIAGIGTLVLLLILARWTVGPAVGLIALAMACLSKGLIYYSSEAKQYSSDVTICVLLLLIAQMVRQKRGRFAAWPLALCSAAAVWISHPAVFVIAAVGIALIIEALAKKQQQFFWGVAIAMAIAAISFALDYLLILRPVRQSQWLHQYWLEAFMPRPIGFGSIKWLWDSFFRVFRTPGGFKVPFFTPGLFVLGLIILTSRRSWLAAALVLPSLFALSAAAAGEYPFEQRLVLFTLPPLFLVTAVGLVWLWRGGEVLRITIAVVTTTILLAGAAGTAAKWIIHPEPVEEIKPVLAYLQTHRQLGDMIFAYAGARPALQYYQDRFGLTDQPIMIGHSVMATSIDDDLSALFGRPRVWILMSHMKVAKTDDQAAYLRILNQHGRQLDRLEVPGEASPTAVYLYDLSNHKAG